MIPIPEWFERWAIEQANKGGYPNNHPISTYIAAASAAYRLLSSQGLRWVKVSEQNPDKTGRYYVKYSGDISGEQREGLFYFNVNWSAGPYKVEYWLLDESPAPIQ